MTQLEFETIQARIDASRKKPAETTTEASIPGDDIGEKELHENIIRWLNDNRIYFVHSRMDRATTTQLGVPDFIIALKDGITLWIEIKTRTGKLTEEQNIARHRLVSAGHKWHIVRSLLQFIEIVHPHPTLPCLDEKPPMTP